MRISTHVLDIEIGRPAAGVALRLDRRNADCGWETVGAGVTDADGRCRDLGTVPRPGVHRLLFDVAGYHRRTGGPGFFPEVCVVVELTDRTRDHHVPLLLSRFGYSTYLGS